MQTDQPSRGGGPILALSCALVFLSQLGVTLYLPSLPNIAGALHLAHGRAALSLLAYFLGSAAPILFWGAAVERYGRKPMLLCSLAIFLAASLMAAGTSDGACFIAARLLQGMGAGGASTIGRILVRDGASGPRLARNLSYLSLAFVSALGGGQFLGGLFEQYAHWRMEFYLLALYSVILMAAALLTTMGAVVPHATTLAAPQSHLARYLAIFKQRGFLLPMTAGALGYGTLIFLQEIGPAIFQGNLGLSARQYGNIGLLLGLSYCGGSLLVHRFAARLGNALLMRLGLRLMLGAACLLLATGAWPGAPGGAAVLAAVLAVYCAVSLGQAILFPNSMAAALDAVSGHGSHATALFGFALQVIATAIGSLAVFIPHQAEQGYGPVAMLLIILTGAALLLARAARKDARESEAGTGAPSQAT